MCVLCDKIPSLVEKGESSYSPNLIATHEGLMKKWILSVLCFASLGASEFEHKITVTPTEKTTEGKKEYLAQVEITKNNKEGSWVIPIPNLICIEGAKAEVKVESPDNMDILVVSVLVPENNTGEAKASIYLTENKEVILSIDEKVKINSKKRFRTWSDIGEKRAQEVEKGVPKPSAA
jgi:hypothetical protein